MNPFLKLVAEDLYKRFGDDLSQCSIVFPSRRAHLYFSHYLGQLISKPIWSPEYTTINEFFRQHTELQVADSLQLSYMLYEEYKNHKPTQETFDQFYYWGNMLLGDFDDVDKYLVDASQLFTNLKDLKDIESDLSYLDEEQLKAIQQYWKVFNTEKLGKHQEFFVDIWKVLFSVYTNFRKTLSAQGIGYEGMICREVIEKLKRQEAFEYNKKAYVFIGFNALNECEKILFRHLNNQQKALFYWDYDEYYSNNVHHEAGRFIRDNILAFPNALNKEHFINFTTKKKQIDFYSLPSQTGQAKLVSLLLKKNHDITNLQWDQTAVVLADEQLLLPVLHAIPNEIEDVNVTMGHPVRSSGIAGLIMLIAELRKNIRQKEADLLFYHRNVKALLNHPFLRSTNSKDCEKIIKEIVSGNKFYISQHELSLNPIFSHVFNLPTSGRLLLDYLLMLLGMVIKTNKDTDEELSDVEKENIYTVYIELNKLKEIVIKIPEEINVDLVFKMVIQILNSTNVSFEGEPLKGLQVMGLLETRALDFDNVILLSMNEGVLPKSVPPMSFIPYNLRRGFGLPTIENQDSIFAYYFYRLIQRANKISLVYNSNNQKGIQSQEMSRFLLQLKYETDFDIQFHTQTFDIKPAVENVVCIPKDEIIMASLYQYLDEGTRNLSPSSISKYIDCPLRFYYSYIAGIKEPDEVEEEIDDMIFGNVLHKTLEEIYKPFVEKSVEKNQLSDICKQKGFVESVVLEAINTEYLKNNKSKKEALFGRNIIIHQVISKYVRKLLEQDVKIAPFKIIGLEKKVSYLLPIQINGNLHSIRMKGSLDRVDELNDGLVRIIDYKSGGRKDMPKDLSQLFDTHINKRNAHVMQLICYALMFQSQAQGKRVAPGLYYVRNLYKDFDWKISIGKDPILSIALIEKEVKQLLSETLLSLFDKNIPFEQTTEKKRCEHCSYASICLR